MRGRRPGAGTTIVGHWKRWPWPDLLAVAPSTGLFVALALYQLLLTPTWVGDDGDDGGYFLMSRNVWRYGLPLLNQNGTEHWSSSWSPAVSTILSPAALLPIGAAVVIERVVVMLSGATAVLLAFAWMRRECGLSRTWAAVGAACLAAGYVYVYVGARVLSDAPAGAALLGGILLLRRDRLRGGIALMALAAALRPINVGALAAALVWLVLTHRRRAVYLATAIGVGSGLALGAVVLALGGFHGYLQQFTQTDGESVVAQGKAVLTGGATLPSHAPERLLFPAILVLAAIGAWRRRLLLETLVAFATGLVLLFYPAGGFSVARYLLPLVPLLIGGVAAAFDSRGSATAVALAGAAGLVIAGYLYEYHERTPSRGDARAVVARQRAAYRWIDDHVPRAAAVVAFKDIQCYLYSGHPTAETVAGVLPGRTYFVDIPITPGAVRLREDVLTRFAGRFVYRNGDVSIIRLDKRRSSSVG